LITKLLVATNNKGKAREYQQMLNIPFLQVVTPAEEGITLDVKETGATFAENAVLKAKAFARASGLLTLADDSGLEVDALDGEPGVYSARYAGENATDAQLIAFLLKKLEAVPPEKRTARFHCVITIAPPEGEPMLCDGACEGIIAEKPQGNNGFGYDPVFYLPQFGKTMAEIPPETKNGISHRARAAEKAAELLKKLS